MKIYHYNEYGYYCGQDIADESPLEPGVFLIPAHATDKIPPLPQEGKNIIFINGEWQLVDIIVIPPPPAHIPTIDEQIESIGAKYNIKFEILQKRLGSVLLSNGLDQEAKTTIIQNEYKELSDQKDLEILELLGGM